MSKLSGLIAVLLCSAAVGVHAGMEEGIAAYNKDDYATALREFQPLAARGVSGAQQRLAWMYASGSGVPRNMAKAFELYRRAAEQGNLKAQTALGYLYAGGEEGVEQNPKEAVLWWLQAAIKGDADAMYGLATLYVRGAPGVPRQPEEGVRWLRQAIDRDHAPAMDLMAQMQANGDGVPKDLTESIRLFRAAVAAGNEDSPGNLAMMYVLGLGVTRNPVVAYALSRVPPQVQQDELRELEETLDDTALAQAKTLAEAMHQPNVAVLAVLDEFITRQDILARERVKAQTTRFRISADGQEVTDTSAKLVWRRCPEGQRFSAGACTGTIRTFTHPEALQYAGAEAARTKRAWRLPSLVNDVMSVRDTGFNPPFNPVVFAGLPQQWLWVSESTPIDAAMHEAYFAHDARFVASHGAMQDTERNALMLVRPAP